MFLSLINNLGEDEKEMTEKEREKQKQIQSLARPHGYKKAREIYAQKRPAYEEEKEEKEKEEQIVQTQREKARRKRWERKKRGFVHNTNASFLWFFFSESMMNVAVGSAYRLFEREEPKVSGNSVTQKVSDHCTLLKYLFF